MTFQSDLTKAELYLQIDEANASLTALERSTRYQRRRYFAEINNSGNSSGAFEAFQELGVAPGAIEKVTPHRHCRSVVMSPRLTRRRRSATLRADARLRSDPQETRWRHSR